MPSPTQEAKTPLPLSTTRPRRLHLRRRRRVPSIRLGGRRRRWSCSGGRILAGFLRRLRLRRLVSRYLRAMKRVKSCYADLMKGVVDGAAAMERVQSRVLMESYFAVPIMPMSVAMGNYGR